MKRAASGGHDGWAHTEKRSQGTATGSSHHEIAADVVDQTATSKPASQLSPEQEVCQTLEAAGDLKFTTA